MKEYLTVGEEIRHFSRIEMNWRHWQCCMKQKNILFYFIVSAKLYFIGREPWVWLLKYIHPDYSVSQFLWAKIKKWWLCQCAEDLLANMKYNIYHYVLFSWLYSTNSLLDAMKTPHIKPVIWVSQKSTLLTQKGLTCVTCSTCHQCCLLIGLGCC